MSRTRVIGLAVLAALGLAFIPEVLPTGPSSSFDASGFLDQGQLLVAAGVIFLGGLMTSLTPCVYPLIPITVGVFGARQAHSRGRAFTLTTAYVVGMGVVFATLGVVAALSGKVFGSVLGNRWFIVALAAFLVVLASSMFGAFDLALPSGVAAKLSRVGGGGFLGALLMGSVAGFIAAPCTGPVLTTVLAWVSRTKDPYLGGLLLFVYALGIGVPFFLIGVFTVRLPKGGVWMEWVKSVFGVALLALAASYLRDAFPALRELAAAFGASLGKHNGVLIAVALVFLGVVVGAIDYSFKEGRQWLPKGLGVLAVVVALLLRSAAQSAPTQHLSDGGREVFTWALKFNPQNAGSIGPFEATLAKAKADCKPVMIDFFADWCAACNELDTHTYIAKEVIAESQRFVTVKVDGTNDNEVLGALYDTYGIEGLPTVTFIDPSGKVLESPRVAGFLPPDLFVGEMRKVAIATCSRAP